MRRKTFGEDMPAR